MQMNEDLNLTNWNLLSLSQLLFAHRMPIRNIKNNLSTIKILRFLRGVTPNINFANSFVF